MVQEFDWDSYKHRHHPDNVYIDYNCLGYYNIYINYNQSPP